MDVELRRDVNAARWLVEQENPRGARNRAREHRFLLVAATQPPDVLARPRRPEANAAAQCPGLGALGGPVQEDAETGEPAKMRQGDVERYVMRKKKPLRPALPRHIGKTAAPRIGGIADAHGAAGDRNLAGPRSAEETFEQTIAARIPDACKLQKISPREARKRDRKDRGQPHPEP